jgi:NAD(P)-dependent dehydrogenase (short-subunit alcohol dehydrogenase family)
MLMENRHAVVYGAGGQIGAAVVHAFAREGVTVSQAGRTGTKLDALARDINAVSGHVADVAQVDALDERGVQRHVDRVVDTVGGLDVCFSAAGDEATLGSPLTERPSLEFVRPITRLVTAHFLISTRVARHVIDRGTGVILTMTGSGLPTAGMGGAMTAWAGVDALCGQLGCELGPHGIRVLWLRSNGVSVEADIPAERERCMLNRLASPDDVGNVAAFLASGHAATMTARSQHHQRRSGRPRVVRQARRCQRTGGPRDRIGHFLGGVSPVDTLATDLAVGAAPPERQGRRSRRPAPRSAGALGVALLVSSARPSAAARRLAPCRPGSRLKTAAPAGDTLGNPVAGPGISPANSAMSCFTRPARGSPKACVGPSPSAPPQYSLSPSSPPPCSSTAPATGSARSETDVAR